jgi:hypothetical protein
MIDPWSWDIVFRATFLWSLIYACTATAFAWHIFVDSVVFFMRMVIFEAFMFIRLWGLRRILILIILIYIITSIIELAIFININILFGSILFYQRLQITLRWGLLNFISNLFWILSVIILIWAFPLIIT